MQEPEQKVESLSEVKARQEANREAYLRRRFTPAELWRQQQAALDELARLRPDLQRKKPTPQ